MSKLKLRVPKSDDANMVVERQRLPKPNSDPVYVKRALYHIQDRETQFEIAFRTISGRWIQKVVRLADIQEQAAFLKTLVDANVSLFGTNLSKEQLHKTVMGQACQMAADRHHEQLVTSELGWHDACATFVLEGGTIPPRSDLIFQAKPKREYAETGKAGTFAKWTVDVARRAVCSSRMMTMIGASLVPPLLGVVEHRKSGYGLDVGGPERCGKTTCLCVAKSLSGEPNPRTWGMSRAGATALLRGHPDIPLFLDESAAYRGDSSIANQVTDLLSGGRPDLLDPSWVADHDANRRISTFRTVLLSTTEGQLPARRRGQRARLISLPATRPGSFGILDYPERADPPITSMDEAGKFIDELDKACSENYGHAFPRFLQSLVDQGTENISQSVHRRVSAFNQATGLVPQDGWTRSVRSNFAMIYAALRLAADSKVLPWTKEEILPAVLRCFCDVLRREADTDKNVVEAIANIRSWIDRAELKATVGDDFKSDRVQEYDAIYDRYKKEPIVLVQREKLAQASGREDVLNLALAKLKSQGMLIAARTGTGVTMQKRLPGVRDKLRFVLFKRAFIENVVAFREADKAEN